MAEFEKFSAIRRKAFRAILEGDQTWLLDRIGIETPAEMKRCRTWRRDHPNYIVDPVADASTHNFYKVLGELSFITRENYASAPEFRDIYSAFETPNDMIRYVYSKAKWTWGGPYIG